jgi:hypothetical protein
MRSLASVIIVALLIIVAVTLRRLPELWQKGPVHVHLACEGKIIVQDKGGTSEDPRVLVIEIRGDAVTVQNFPPLYRIKSNDDRALLFADDSDPGNNTGHIDRYSGRVGVMMKIEDATTKFNGRCRRAEPLF